MPASPSDGMTITVESTQQVTAITVNANTGQSIVGAPSQLVPNQSLSWIYRLANTTWYPFFGGAGRATSLVSGTAVASTSGTSIDFTSIPSWVKRITVMFYDVSTSGSSAPQVQIGSGSFTTTGYTSVGQNGTTVQSSTSGFITTGSWAGTSIKSGSIVLTLLSSNVWVSSGVSIDIPAANSSYCSGRVTISGTLDRVRITTLNGTDTFDAGSVNILYE